MTHKFPPQHITLCKQYIKYFKPSQDEILNIDGVYQLQTWNDTGKIFSAIYNTITKEWIYV